MSDETPRGDPSEEDRETEPEPLPASERRFAEDASTAEPGDHLDQGESDAGAEIEESGQKQGVDAVEEELGQRRARAEQGGRHERGGRAGGSAHDGLLSERLGQPRPGGFDPTWARLDGTLRLPI